MYIYSKTDEHNGNLLVVFLLFLLLLFLFLLLVVVALLVEGQRFLLYNLKIKNILTSFMRIHDKFFKNPKKCL